jgi:murein DD-endopeptidase MepM/ murein hydrolase activator NlpD
MSSGIIDTIKEVAINAYEATNPVALVFGKVTSTNPVKIQVGENLTLSKDFLVINGAVSKGDDVTLIRCQGGQKYVVLGTRTVTTENTIYISGGEATSSASGKWQYPYKGSYVQTSPFGWRQSTNSYHKGVDLVGTSSKHLYPVNSGKVVSVITGWGGGYGNHVIVSHGNNIWSLYAHMKAIYVKNGQTVTKNTILGVEGSTGNSTGSHVHLEIRKSFGGSQVDPISFLNSH